MFIYFDSNCLRTCQYNPQYAQCMSYTQCPDKTMAIQSIHSQLLFTNEHELYIGQCTCRIGRHIH